MKFRIITLLSLGFISVANAQEISRPNVEGTYQLQVINMRARPNIPASIDSIVLKHRHPTDTTYVRIYENVRLMVLPHSTIARKDFRPIKQTGLTTE